MTHPDRQDRQRWIASGLADAVVTIMFREGTLPPPHASRWYDSSLTTDEIVEFRPSRSCGAGRRLRGVARGAWPPDGHGIRRDVGRVRRRTDPRCDRPGLHLRRTVRAVVDDGRRRDRGRTAGGPRVVQRVRPAQGVASAPGGSESRADRLRVGVGRQAEASARVDAARSLGRSGASVVGVRVLAGRGRGVAGGGGRPRGRSAAGDGRLRPRDRVGPATRRWVVGARGASSRGRCGRRTRRHGGGVGVVVDPHSQARTVGGCRCAARRCRALARTRGQGRRGGRVGRPRVHSRCRGRMAAGGRRRGGCRTAT